MVVGEPPANVHFINASCTMSVFSLLIVLVLLFLPLMAGVALMLNSRRRGLKFPSCGGCGYDVTGTVGTSTRCPECGQEFIAVGIVPPGGRRNPVTFWAGLALVVIPITCIGTGLVLSYLRAQSSMQAARAAQVQAVAAQQAAQAQANATKPIPPPLADARIESMTLEEASDAYGRIAAALARTDLSDEDQQRLNREYERLASRVQRP